MNSRTTGDLVDAMRFVPDAFAFWGQMPRAWWARYSGMADVQRVQAARIVAIVRHARAASPFYRARYRDCGDAPALQDLPVVTRRELMADFEGWVTDPRITLAGVRRFLEGHHAARRYLDRYYVWTSSGTSGVPGVYVQDSEAMAAYDAMVALQVIAGGSAFRACQGWATRGRGALVAAPGGHHASVASFLRLAHSMPWAQARVFSILDPLAKLCADLTEFDPGFLAGYPTALHLLAQEQLAGRLSLRPTAVWGGGECLNDATLSDIERAFGCGVVDEYGASECMNIAFRCRLGWMHVNADWAVLEPVDGAGRPVPAGEVSESVLLTNLANRVQPIIRYDLGDSILVRPDACECGNPLPAMRVEGRRDDVLCFDDVNGHPVRLLPLAFDTLIEEALGGCPYQVVQTAPHAIAVRLQPAGTTPAAAWLRVQPDLRAWLDAQGLAGIALELDHVPPRADASGKLRHTLRLHHAADARRADGDGVAGDMPAMHGRRGRNPRSTGERRDS